MSREQAAGTVRKTWRVEGMICPNCERVIERALQNAPGVYEPSADHKKGTLTAGWDAARISEREIGERLAAKGYRLKAGRGRETALQLALFFAAAVLVYFVLTATPAADWLKAFPTARTGMGLGALFALGLTTSLHCVAMCGGI
ncbi:MAG: cation transporter, partial [Clostridia bacterium]|nr:cation transporter [Clostridia bacterium]